MGEPSRSGFAATAVSLTLLIAACSAAPPSSPSAAPPSSPSAPGTTPAAAPTGSTEPVEPADTTQGRIAEALAAGTIDYPTSLLYRAYAVFGSPDLPADYRGVDGSDEDDFGLPIEARKYRSGLPAQVAAELDALLARPTDPASAFAGRVPGAEMAGAMAIGGTAAVAQVQPCQQIGSTSWSFMDAAEAARVWAPCYGGAAAPEVDLAQVVGWIDAFYRPMVSVMGPPIFDTGDSGAGGSSAIDVYFVDFCIERDGQCRSIVGADAVTNPTLPFEGKKSSGYILLSAAEVAADPSAAHNSLIHEFFHVLQFAHNYDALVAQGDLPHWFAEASAKWAETHFRRETSGAVHNFWFPRFQSSSVSLHRPASAAANYAAYIWPFFMELQAGAAAVGAAWSNAEEAANFADLDDAIDGALGFAGSFRHFAAKNINQALSGDALGVRYDQFDSNFGAGFGPNNKLQTQTTISNGDAFLALGPVPALSALYYPLRPAEGVETIRFLFGLDPADSIDVDFVYERADGAGWKRRTVATPAEEERFCFNRPEEKFSVAYMVVSNHDHRDAVGQGGVSISAVEQPCDLGGQGTVTISREQHGTYTSARDNPVEVDMVETATITFDLSADEFDPGTLNATHSTITWSHSTKSVETGEECAIVDTAEGGGSWSADEGPTVMFGWSAPDGTLFGMMPNEEMYALQVWSMDNDLPEGDPNGWVQLKTDICGEIGYGFGLPFITLAIVDGDLPDDPTSLSGSRQRQVPALNPQLPPITETVTWSITLRPEQVP